MAKYECVDREKAVAVATDVLQSLDRRNHLTGNSYLSGMLPAGVVDQKNFATTDLRDVVELAEDSCEVCLLGSCLLSKAKLFNAVLLPDVATGWRHDDGVQIVIDAGRPAVIAGLRDVMGDRVSDLLETFFEAVASGGPREAFPDNETWDAFHDDLDRVEKAAELIDTGDYDEIGYDRAFFILSHLIKEKGAIDVAKLVDAVEDEYGDDLDDDDDDEDLADDLDDDEDL